MHEEIERSKRRAEWAMERFLRVVKKVPPDKLTWSPAPTAKSALQIAAHCAGFSGGFAQILATGGVPPTDEFLPPIHARIDAINTLEEAEAVLRQGMADAMAAMDKLSPEQVESVLETPIGPTSMRWFMGLPAEHLINHIGQIDYLQTCWGDQEVHL